MDLSQVPAEKVDEIISRLPDLVNVGDHPRLYSAMERDNLPAIIGCLSAIKRDGKYSLSGTSNRIAALKARVALEYIDSVLHS